jgi:hypothetical protein
VSSWPTDWRFVDNYNNTGKRAFVIGLSEFAFIIEEDGTQSSLFLAAAAPQGGLPRGESNYPALLRGPEGRAPSVVKGSFVSLAPDDPTEDFFDVQLRAPATEISAAVYEINAGIHKGAPGDDGAALITPEDYGTPGFGQVLSVAAGEETFELTYPKVGGLHIPAAITAAPDGSTGEATMCQFDISAGTYNFDWIPDVSGNAITIASSTDSQVDLIVRKDSESGGNIIARGVGMPGVAKWQPNIVGGVESGTNIVSAGAAATIYVRTKRMDGSATYGADDATARFQMRVIPA